ncbi:NUDIX hydrolase [Pseudooceanicola sp. 502str34]
MTDKTAIRDAATVIVLRDRATTPRVLMGQRGSKAAFMPSMFVFPGGAVDPGDGAIPLASPLPALCAGRISEGVAPEMAQILPAAAIRELWEETGLILGQPGTWNDAPEDWQGFAQAGFRPSAAALQFVFRAITPPGRPRRFDARFFLVDAGEVANDLDDFGDNDEELEHLQWIPLTEVRQFKLPFITQVVLAEIAQRAADPSPPASVPFFSNRDEEQTFQRLHGRPMPQD